MDIVSFRVRKYRNIQDSGEVELLDRLTCMVGKNQAGTSIFPRCKSVANREAKGGRGERI